MDISNITIYADYQKLTVRSGVMRYASDTVNYVRADFEFGKGWEGFDAIQAVWKSRYETVSVLLDGDGCCMVPQEVLARRSKVQVNLVGFTSEENELTARLTSYPALVLDVDTKAELYGSETAVITPNQFEQFAGIVAEDASSARTSATEAAASASASAQSASDASQSATSASINSEQASDSAMAASLYQHQAETYAQSASTSEQNASTSASEASQSAQAASASAQSASTDATRAETARAFLEGVSADATTLAPGSQATASYDEGVFSFGIPQGGGGDALCVVEFTYDSANDKYTASKSANQIYQAWTNGKYVIGQISRENNYAFPILRGIGYEESNGENYPIAQFVLDENQITSNYTMAYDQLVIMMHRVGPGIDDDEIRYTHRSADAVPTSRKVNGKILYNDITLTAADVGALPSSTVIPTYTAGTGIDITNGVISIDLDNAEGSNY